MDLTESKVIQLHEYVQRFQHVDNFEELVQIVDWNFLYRILKITDKDIITDKLEEVFQDSKEEIYTSPIFLDEELEEPLTLAHVEDNPFHGEVAAMFAALHLYKYTSIVEMKQKEVVSTTNESHSYAENYDLGSSPYTRGERGKGIEEKTSKDKLLGPVTTGVVGANKVNSSDAASNHVMAHLNPFGLGQYSDNQTKLGKPAPIEITNLNVLTKPDVSASSKIRPAQEGPIKSSKGSPFVLADKLKYIRRKSFGFGEQKKLQQLSPSMNSTAVSPVKDPVTTTAPIVRSKSNRRTSMVEDSLPPYIRKQLETHMSPKTPPQPFSPGEQYDLLHRTHQSSVDNTSTIIQEELDEIMPPVTLTKKQSSRLRNVLSNSQSLYTISKNTLPSLPPSQGESQASTVSDYLNDTDDDDGLEDDDEDDREYVSPTVVSPYLGFEDDDENEDFPDFENLSREDSTKDDDEDAEEEDDGDEYLFTSLK
ncbi:hypothetical protein CLIB1423_08S01332 [[Candida] railenensis]|uniref:Uncharacterized protein n=1 Tax=[Candida] railenensis TaxID=45579 RepID=A0A9P0QP39_9ASCO|nr:hypothetical protein CLIB1423_08S01332 [[Candida] railenensis]